MSFFIDQNICARCGSCIGNCPNRAIVFRDSIYTVTNMCFDCGTCTQYCASGAIGEGTTRAERDNKILDNALKEKLGIKKNIVAMKFTDKAPDDVPVEEGPHFWCGICGDIFDGDGKPVYFTSEASTCGGITNIGMRAKKASKEEFDAAMEASVIGEGKSYSNKDILAKHRSLFPQFHKAYPGVIIGSLENIPHPDLIIIPINAHQLCMVSTAFAFDTGEVIMGHAGPAACLMTVPTPLIDKRPVFAAGDDGGRTFMRLDHAELVISFPYSLVPGLVENLDRTVFAHE